MNPQVLSLWILFSQKLVEKKSSCRADPAPMSRTPQPLDRRQLAQRHSTPLSLRRIIAGLVAASVTAFSRSRP
jgi:hypothetical protein